MNLREEVAHLIEEVIVDPLQYQSITQSDRIINKVLDAVCETNRRSAKELGLDEIEIHYLIEDVNKLRQEK